MSAPTVNTHGLRIEVGKHAGEPYTRLPINYLRWMVQVGHSGAIIAQAELDRRGTVNPDLDVSGHAVDRASQAALEIWQATRNGDEGLHAWLCRIATQALKGEPCKPDRYVWGPLVLVFELSTAWPVLKTVMYSPRAAGVPKATDPDHPGHKPATQRKP